MVCATFYHGQRVKRCSLRVLRITPLVTSLTRPNCAHLLPLVNSYLVLNMQQKSEHNINVKISGSVSVSKHNIKVKVSESVLGSHSVTYCKLSCISIQNDS